MISRIRGKLVARGVDGVEIATAGGVVYEIAVPLTVAERLPPLGEEMELRTVYVVREDHAALYGFLEVGERLLFQRLLGASGVGGKVALAMLSTYSAPRLARVLAERDVGALVQVPGIGKKKAEKLVVELADRVGDLPLDGTEPLGTVGSAQAAVRALVALGMSFAEAEGAVRGVLEDGALTDTNELVRRALARA
ncbi:MAG: Holliday junction branch migration protein RuvA [Gemmatimonadetes bacterium]|nr:Holliday junction branch migration protein RuvA [Gemmatimonadota bacterium]